MAHAFDTGLARTQRTLIRDGIVELLGGLLHNDHDGELGGYLRAVIPWGGVIRGFTDEIGIDLLWSALNGRAPAIAVCLGDKVGQNAGLGGFNVKADLELVLYHYSNNQISMTDGRTSISTRAGSSNARDPGLDVMLEHAEELVLGQRVGATLATNPIGEKSRSTPSIKQVVFLREEELRTDKTLTLWAQRFSVRVDRVIDPHRGVTQMLEEIRTVLRTTDEAVEDIVAADQEIPGDAVLELQTTTVDTPEPPPEEP